jgi:hypothetical protein
VIVNLRDLHAIRSLLSVSRVLFDILPS